MGEPLRVEVYRVKDNVRIGSFYIPGDVDDVWRYKNIPILIKAAQLLAEEAIGERN